ncbi:MAG: DUF2087 domain-containing protein [Alphaproteobacteria bacterium]|nr:DUF2087 domain-containing protein [Alphaproteobacteria bacterium]
MPGSPRDLIDENGIVTRWPKKQAERQLVPAHLARPFEPGRIYAEAEVNDMLRARHSFEDWALLRRELCEAGILDRDPRTGTYWVVETG